MVPKINSQREKSREKWESTSKDTAPPVEILQDKENQNQIDKTAEDKVDTNNGTSIDNNATTNTN